MIGGLLGCRASIKELLDDWWASHARDAQEAQAAQSRAKPFIDPEEYGGHVNRSLPPRRADRVDCCICLQTAWHSKLSLALLLLHICHWRQALTAAAQSTSIREESIRVQICSHLYLGSRLRIDFGLICPP